MAFCCFGASFGWSACTRQGTSFLRTLTQIHVTHFGEGGTLWSLVEEGEEVGSSPFFLQLPCPVSLGKQGNVLAFKEAKQRFD